MGKIDSQYVIGGSQCAMGVYDIDPHDVDDLARAVSDYLSLLRHIKLVRRRLVDKLKRVLCLDGSNSDGDSSNDSGSNGSSGHGGAGSVGIPRGYLKGYFYDLVLDPRGNPSGNPSGSPDSHPGGGLVVGFNPGNSPGAIPEVRLWYRLRRTGEEGGMVISYEEEK